MEKSYPGTEPPLNSSSFNLRRLSMPERDVKRDETIFSSLGVDPLVKTILVMEEQSTTRRFSHMNSSFLKVISFCAPSKDMSMSTRQRKFGFFARICRASCCSNALRRVSLAICLAFSNDDSKLPQLLLFNSSSSNFGSLPAPEIDILLVEDKIIFSSSWPAPSSKVILLKFEPSTRRYLRHLNSPSLKLIMCSVNAMCRSLTHCNLGSFARMFIPSWFNRVLLRVTLTSLSLSPLVITGRRFPIIVVPEMLRLSRILG